MRLQKQLLCLLFSGLFLLPWASAGAASQSGQSYQTFLQYYKEDISFINDNDSRHLIPLSIAKAMDPLEQGRIIYSLIGDTLNVTIHTDLSGLIIESCVITLTAPSGMEYGNTLYNDFAISGYQSYALLMAMHTDPSSARRYDLVTDVVAGMAAGNGVYQRQLGVYTLSCTRQDNVAELRFDKGGVSAPQESAAPEDSQGADTGPVELDEEELEGML